MSDVLWHNRSHLLFLVRFGGIFLLETFYTNSSILFSIYEEWGSFWTIRIMELKVAIIGEQSEDRYMIDESAM